ncbi:hypothetical protein, partial [Nostoc edaphicum]|uniref:hypothetical protein n=1 Tax=Nostoc edaphicum TaxID=264686 RepID=UPI001D15681A
GARGRKELDSLTINPAKFLWWTYILYQATRSRGYTDKTCLRRLKSLDFALVRVGGLRLYSRDF